MKFTIVTPSYNQLDWLRLCVASVADQVGAGREHTAYGTMQADERSNELRVAGGEREGETGDRKPEIRNIGVNEAGRGKIFIEHIVRDAGTPGIEEFARRMGADFYRDGKRVFGFQRAVDGESAGADSGNVERKRYSLTIYSEKDAGMYDAVNKGLRKASGEICAYLNCDEQYLPGALGWVADYFEVSPETEVLFGAAIVTKADGSYRADRRVMPPTRWHTLVSGNLSFFTSSTFLRRHAVIDRGVLLDPHWRVCGDAVWALRFLEAGLRMQATHRPLSAFAETGMNMSAAGNACAAEESRRLASMAPGVVRALRPSVLLAYRLRRWWSGAYALKPHSYAVYTAGEADRRQRFDVDRPSFRWQMGAALSPE